MVSGHQHGHLEVWQEDTLSIPHDRLVYSKKTRHPTGVEVPAQTEQNGFPANAVVLHRMFAPGPGLPLHNQVVPSVVLVIHPESFDPRLLYGMAFLCR